MKFRGLEFRGLGWLNKKQIITSNEKSKKIMNFKIKKTFGKANVFLLSNFNDLFVAIIS